MKKTLLFILFAGATPLWAAPIDYQQAKAHATAFFHEQGGVVLPAGEQAVHRGVRKAGKYVNQAAYYVFNADEAKGFVIISGDDRTLPVLGYSSEGSFDVTHLPDNFKGWLQACEEFISHMDALGMNLQSSTIEHAAITPLLTTQWDQGTPYNEACPTYLGEPTLTGCTATALAQVMNYTRWPESECTAIPSYTTSTYRIGMPELPNTIFDWDAMEDASDGEVARLMLYAGQSVKSDYTVNSTAGHFARIPQALKQYFGYDSNVRFVMRSNYSIDEWDNLLLEELSAGRPVLYSGYTTSSGHAFVCDGYDGQGLYHINWGWGGAYDGYYQISVLRPGMGGSGGSSTSDGYAMEQNAIVGIQPPTGEAQLPLLLTSQRLRVEGTMVYCNYYNYNDESIKSYIGFGRVDEEGKVLRMSSYGSAIEFNPISDEGVNGYSFGFDVGTAGLAAGTYKIVPICREYGKTAWERISAENNYVEVIVKPSGVVTLTLHPIVKLQATSILCTGNKVVGHMQDVEVQMNNLSEEVNIPIYLFASTTKNKGGYVGSTQVVLSQEGQNTVYMNFLPETAGTYNLWVCADEAGTEVLGTSTVVIRKAPTEQAKLQKVSMKVTLTDGVKVVVKFKNVGTDTYLRPLWIGLHLNNGWADSRQVFVPVEPDAQGEAIVEFDNLQPGKTYAAYAYYYPHFDTYDFQHLAGPVMFVAPQTTGIMQSEVIADRLEDCYTIQGIRVEHPKAPGIYIRGGKKIIVK